MRLQRNLLLEWGFGHPRMLLIIVVSVILLETKFLLPSQDDHLIETHFVPIENLQVDESLPNVEEVKVLVKKKDREETIEMIKNTYGTEYEEYISKQKDIILLARLIQAEAGNQDIEGQCLVADVVMNRLRSDKFPDSIEEIIYQEGQFGVMTDGAFEKAKGNTTPETVRIATLAVNNPEEALDSDDVLYFNTEKIDGVENWFQHGDHWFGW